MEIQSLGIEKTKTEFKNTTTITRYRQTKLGGNRASTNTAIIVLPGNRCWASTNRSLANNPQLFAHKTKMLSSIAVRKLLRESSTTDDRFLWADTRVCSYYGCNSQFISENIRRIKFKKKSFNMLFFFCKASLWYRYWTEMTIFTISPVTLQPSNCSFYILCTKIHWASSFGIMV